MRKRIAAAGVAGALGLGLSGLGPAHAYQLDTVNLIACAQEGGVCRMPYPTNVYFGVPGRTNGRPFPQGGVIACNVQTFGDPAPGRPKSCWYAPRISTGGSSERYRNDDYDDRRRDTYRDNRDYYDRPPVRRPYDDDDDRPAPRRYRGDPDDY
ncbi:hypothetical protein SAMN05216360_104129 [Methylobacterium phyllostachyos]|uniref:Secreted protein n=1 Tax=Methylobacterium phyllostachyos TaxID=582672 RepID=A0A1G9WVP9_9HYPH|nr:hypothetical protein [Methylobacterium phyllostachyos]SDM88125.1 hypothetical protein SAMN05216360_104129 [Methylobacterium phyllostachyos]